MEIDTDSGPTAPQQVTQTITSILNRHTIAELHRILDYLRAEYLRKYNKAQLVEIAAHLIEQHNLPRGIIHTALLLTPNRENRQPGRRRLQNTTEIQALVQVSAAPTSDLPLTPNSPIKCKVCFETLNASAFPDRPTTTTCKHVADVCSSCLQKHIGHQMRVQIWNQIQCPSDHCRQYLQHQDVRDFAVKEDFDWYDKLSVHACLEDPDNPEPFIFCSVDGCRMGQFHVDDCDGTSIVVCCECGAKKCFRHRVKWHEGETCEEYDENNLARMYEHEQDDKKSREMIDRETKDCPNCSWSIFKNGGCNHMTCESGSCRYQFCWECCANWSKTRRDPANHLFECRYHRNRVDR